MSKVKDFFKSPHIQIALATGFSIIVMAYFSKRILPRPIGYLPSAIPPFLMAIYEAVLTKYKNKKISTAWYWVVAILLTTAIIIGFHAI
jgi:predicted histidine transporter YuiF (NhaC family)